MKVVLWQNIRAFHQAPWIAALAARDGVNVTWVVERQTNADRVRQGWPQLDANHVKVVVAPSDDEIDRICRSMEKEDVHVLSGPRGFPLSMKALKASRNTPATIGILCENRDTGEWRQKLRLGLYRNDYRMHGVRVAFALIQGFFDPHGGRAWFRRVGYPDEKLFPFAYFPPAPATLGEPDPAAGFKIVYLGQLIPRKGVDILLAALGRLRDLPWNLEIIGGGTHQRELAAQAANLGLADKVEFKGNMPNAEAMRRVGLADLFVLPSRFDGWGAVVNEALLQGVPVVCSDRCGAKDLLREEWRGSIFQSGDDEDLAGRLRCWIASGRLDGMARKRISDWSREAIGGEAGADYFLGVLQWSLRGAERPIAPWLRSVDLADVPRFLERSRTRTLIENPILPPYRLAVFQALSRSRALDVTLAYGAARKGAALQSIVDPPGIGVAPLRNLFVGRTPTITFQFGLLRVIRLQRWEAIVATFDPRLMFNLLALPLAHARGAAFIWWGHGIRPRWRFRRVYRRLALAADSVILYSGEGKQRLIELGVPPEKLFVAWNSIDTEEIRGLASDEWTGRNRILCIGRLIPEKRVDLLIRAFGKALPNLPKGVRLTVVGEGPELIGLRKLAADTGVAGRVDWLGAIYGQTELAPIFNESLLCVSPGYVGLSAIHGLAFGVPMLFADDEPNSPEVEALEIGVNSRSFAARSEEALAASLVETLSDRPRLQQMGTAGQQRVTEQFSVANMVQTFEDAIAYACAARGRK